MLQYTDGKRVITATEKAYEVLYKARGYKPKQKPRTKKAGDDDGAK